MVLRIFVGLWSVVISLCLLLLGSGLFWLTSIIAYQP